SLYEGFQTSNLVLSLQGQITSPMVIERDDKVPQFRKRIIISAAVDPVQHNLIEKQVKWEKARRYGRSLAVTVTCDSWRDSGGKLWAPNHLAQIELPALKVPGENWCIGSVTYLRDENGQHASVVLMPKEAFLPEPGVFLPMPPTLQSFGASP